jgi:hypothetical protein
MTIIKLILIIAFMAVIVYSQYLEQVEKYNKRKDDKE